MFASRLLDIIQCGACVKFRELLNAHQDLRDRCVLCGTFHGRPQELNQHLRCHHSALIPHVFAKMAQLCRAQVALSHAVTMSLLWQVLSA